MIKINLLGESLTQAAAKKSEKAIEQQAEQIYAKGESGKRSSVPVAGVMVAVFFVLASGSYYLWLTREVDKAEAKKVKLEAQKKELEQYTRLHQQYMDQKELLKKKLEVLRGLKKNQEITVKMMEQIANMIPDDVWFDELYINGPNISISGFGRSFEAVNLLRSRLTENRQWFSKVNHQTSKRDKDKNVVFSITFQLADTAS